MKHLPSDPALLSLNQLDQKPGLFIATLSHPELCLLKQNQVPQGLAFYLLNGS